MIPKLKGLERTIIEKKIALSKNHPLLLSLYLDTACNLNCIYCFLDSGKSHKKEQLFLEQYKNIILQAKNLGVKSVLYFGAGEPLLDTKLFPLIEYSNKLGLYAVMFTNATLLTKEITNKIKNLDLSVVASIKSKNPSILEGLTNVKGSAEKIYAGFQHLLEVGLNKTKPTRLGMDILICKQTYKEVPELIDYCIKNNIHPMVESMLWKGRAVKNYDKLALTTKQKEYLSEELKNKFPELSKERAFLDGSGCDLDQYTIFVNYNGDVWQCFSRNIIAGNIKKQTLKQIWNKPLLKQLRINCKTSNCNICPGRLYNKEKNLS